MNTQNNKLLIAAALLFAVNCADVSDASGKDVTPNYKEDTSPITGVKIDTLLFAYAGHGIGNIDNALFGIHHFQNDAQLTSFLELIGYDGNDTNNTLAHRPDFKKWAYFAIAGHLFRHTIDILYGNDAVTINYVEYNLSPPCTHPCRALPSQPIRSVVIYFIPFTEKPVKCVLTRKLRSEYEY